MAHASRLSWNMSARKAAALCFGQRGPKFQKHVWWQARLLKRSMHLQEAIHTVYPTQSTKCHPFNVSCSGTFVFIFSPPHPTPGSLKEMCVLGSPVRQRRKVQWNTSARVCGWHGWRKACECQIYSQWLWLRRRMQQVKVLGKLALENYNGSIQTKVVQMVTGKTVTYYLY